MLKKVRVPKIFDLWTTDIIMVKKFSDIIIAAFDEWKSISSKKKLTKELVILNLDNTQLSVRYLLDLNHYTKLEKQLNVQAVLKI